MFSLPLTSRSLLHYRCVPVKVWVGDRLPPSSTLNYIVSRRLGILCFLGLSFVASVQGQNRPLVLISENTSTRAIAFESITSTREPFQLTSLISWGPDSRTRVVLFALNLRLEPGDEPWNVTAEAEDGTQRRYPCRLSM